MMIKRMMLMFAILCLTGCQTLGFAPADTFNKKWAEAEQTDTTALASALSLAQAGVITPDELRGIEAQTDNVKSGLDLARSLHATNASAASIRLDQLVAALAVLQQAIQQKQTVGAH